MLHFDVNKTILLTDSIDSKTCDDCVREAVSELYWGVIESRPPPEGLTWSWVDVTPQARPPPVPSWAQPEAEVVAYAEYCRRALDNKKDRTSAMRTFRLVKDTPDVMQPCQEAKLMEVIMGMTGNSGNNRAVKPLGYRTVETVSALQFVPPPVVPEASEGTEKTKRQLRTEGWAQDALRKAKEAVDAVKGADSRIRMEAVDELNKLRQAARR